MGMTAEGGGGIPNHGNFLLNGIPHPASPGAPFHKGAGRGTPQGGLSRPSADSPSAPPLRNLRMLSYFGSGRWKLPGWAADSRPYSPPEISRGALQNPPSSVTASPCHLPPWRGKAICTGRVGPANSGAVVEPHKSPPCEREGRFPLSRGNVPTGQKGWG